ncbi:MAG: SPOR domain-containing protein [bacterium]|nr:SPOR domain-containing protein [bacterium]
MRMGLEQGLETARLAGKLTLAYAVAAWLLYLLLGLALPGLLAKGGWLLALALILALPVPRLLTRRREGREPAALAAAWEAIDRRDAVQLAAFHQSRIQWAGMSPGRRVQWEDQLLEAWTRLPGGQISAGAGSLLELLHRRPLLAAREVELLRRLDPAQVDPLDLLGLWNRVDAAGLPLDHACLNRVLRGLPAPQRWRALRRVRPLLFQLAREGHEAAGELLRGALDRGALVRADLPEDLSVALGEGEEARPEAPPEGRISPSAMGLLGKAMSQVSRQAGTGARQLRASWVRPAILASAVVLALLASRGLRQPSPTLQAPSVSKLAYAPPANVHGGFTLQVTASRDSLQVVHQVEALHQAEIYAYALPPRQNSTWYRVRLGWFAERAAADSTASLLKARGHIDEWYVANFDLAGRLHEPSPGVPGGGTTLEMRGGPAGKEHP